MIQELFAKNLSIKVTALVLAVLLELYFYSPENYVTIEVPASISIINVPSSLMIVEPDGAEQGLKAMVTLRGPNILTQQVLRSQPTFFVSVVDNVQNNFSAVLNPEDLRLPLGVELINTKPPRIDLRFEKVVKKELPLVATQTGSLAKGYRVVDLKVFPKKIYVRGPQSELEGVLQLKTADVNLSGVDSSRRIEVPIKDVGRMTTYNLNMASVEVEVEPIVEQKVFSNLNITVLAPQGYAATVEPSKANLTLTGPTNIISELKASDIKIFADARELSAGKHSLKINANLPDQVSIISSDPSEIALTVVSSSTK